MKKKNVPKEERETKVLFDEADDIATIYTFNSGLKKRLATFAEKYPDLCTMTVDDAVYGSVTSTTCLQSRGNSLTRSSCALLLP